MIVFVVDIDKKISFRSCSCIFGAVSLLFLKLSLVADETALVCYISLTKLCENLF